MSPDQFLQAADFFPDAALLLTKAGKILAANKSVRRLGLAPQQVRGRELSELTTTPAATLAEYLRACSRSREPVIGALDFAGEQGRPVPCRCDGAAAYHDPAGAETHILLRLTPKESSPSQFRVLNQKIEELTAEVQRRRQLEKSLREQRELLHVTLQSIGDAMIATDTQGRVTSLNPVAQALTGWEEEDARGRPLEAVFRIVNEHTRRTVANPVARALAEGVIVGLANHSLLIAKDDTERPIDDSAAPIRDREGRVVGAVLVFRDITERKQAEAHIARLLAREQGRSEQLRQLAAASLTIHSADSAASVLGVVRAEAERLVGAAHVDVVMGGAAPPGHFSVPLPGRGGRPLGHIGLTAGAAPFTEDDAAILAQLAHMAAVAFENVRLYEELREGDRRKDEFLATLAHELRNPLAPIRNGLQVLRLAGNSGPVLEQARSMMERQVVQMVRLVDDLLDLSRITRGKIELRKERAELAGVIAGAVETSRPLIEASGHQFTAVLPSTPVPLVADVARLAQVFSNLLNNAAKYTERGGHIRLTAERRGAEVVVTVRDSGVGIPADMLPRVFEMFTQVDRTLERAQGGLGIGLTLVRRLVEMHGGSVEAHSEGHGKGSEFVVRLPVGEEPPGLEGPRGPGHGERPAGLPKRRILVVDDNKDSAASLAMMLSLMGHETRTAFDGLASVEAAAAFRPDLILLDIGLPKLNGYDACRRIREQPGGRGIVIVACTGWGQDEDRRRSSDAGFNYHLVKPVDPAALQDLLGRLDR